VSYHGICSSRSTFRRSYGGDLGEPLANPKIPSGCPAQGVKVCDDSEMPQILYGSAGIRFSVIRDVRVVNYHTAGCRDVVGHGLTENNGVVF